MMRSGPGDVETEAGGSVPVVGEGSACSHEAVDPHQLLRGKGLGVLGRRNGW